MFFDHEYDWSGRGAALFSAQRSHLGGLFAASAGAESRTGAAHLSH
jgi:hypothetical protein